jgi:nucleotide-binding universal stress UspA family protein
MTAKQIIVGYDGSPDARAAADWALDEADRTGAPVLFVYAMEWPAFIPAASMIPATSVWPDAETERALATMVDDMVTEALQSHPGVAAASAMVRGPAALTLVDRSTHAAMVVLGSRGHNAFAGLLLGSVSVSVSAHAHCPVVVVRGTEGGSTERSRRPVVVGVDDSACANLALGFAAAQAAERAVGLHVVRAWTPPTSPWSGPVVDPDEITVAERAALDDTVAGWRDKYPAVVITSDVVVDHPARALAEASRGGQLMVVGSRGRGGLRGMVLGSTSQYLLHHASCSVAVVRELAVE